MGACRQAWWPLFDPRTHKVEGKNRIPQFVSCLHRIPWLEGACMGTHTHTHYHHLYIVHKYNKSLLCRCGNWSSKWFGKLLKWHVMTSILTVITLKINPCYIDDGWDHKLDSAVWFWFSAWLDIRSLPRLVGHPSGCVRVFSERKNWCGNTYPAGVGKTRGLRA